MAAALAVAGVSGCATKNYVRTQTTAGGTHRPTGPEDGGKQPADSRCGQPGAGRHHQAQGAADTATQNAQSASKQASDAEMAAANDAVHRADSLDSVVKGLDQYKQVADVSVTFGFDKPC
jgi:OOP family OmpA-OmpF porin